MLLIHGLFQFYHKNEQIHEYFNKFTLFFILPQIHLCLPPASSKGFSDDAKSAAEYMLHFYCRLHTPDHTIFWHVSSWYRSRDFRRKTLKLKIVIFGHSCFVLQHLNTVYVFARSIIIRNHFHPWPSFIILPHPDKACSLKWFQITQSKGSHVDGCRYRLDTSAYLVIPVTLFFSHTVSMCLSKLYGEAKSISCAIND